MRHNTRYRMADTRPFRYWTLMTLDIGSRNSVYFKHCNALSGLMGKKHRFPGALPWAKMLCPFGALIGKRILDTGSVTRRIQYLSSADAAGGDKPRHYTGRLAWVVVRAYYIRPVPILIRVPGALLISNHSAGLTLPEAIFWWARIQTMVIRRNCLISSWKSA